MPFSLDEFCHKEQKKDEFPEITSKNRDVFVSFDPTSETMQFVVVGQKRQKGTVFIECGKQDKEILSHIV